MKSKNNIINNIKIDNLTNEIGSIVKYYSGLCDKSFKMINEMIVCDLGGTFYPITTEMKIFSQTNYLDKEKIFMYNLGSIIVIKESEEVFINNAAARCYYEILKHNSSLEYIGLMIKGAGTIEVQVICQNLTTEKVVLKETINFGAEVNEKYLSHIYLSTLPVNGSLCVKIGGISETSAVYGFRWVGYIPKKNANLGLRVILIRTFGSKKIVTNNISRIIEYLSQTNADILLRTLFIIYDASLDKNSELKVKTVNASANIIEISGPNFGGGGNASLLVSLMLRIDDALSDKISEIILMDDDAVIDAETVVRHDAFITIRKSNIVSTSVIYHAESPTVIQEFGGIWGKFFSPQNHKVSINTASSERTLIPYLIRSTRDIEKRFDCVFLGTPQDADFATFIFISFPYTLLKHTGAPLPFFLRNDDVEICLRCITHGGKVVVNPNIHAWHNQRHNAVSEFFAIFHGLLINNLYGGLSKKYFFELLMERIVHLSKVGNFPMLLAYSHVLESFAEGVKNMQPDTIYSNYKKIMSDINNLDKNIKIEIPLEVVDVNKDEVGIVSTIDNNPTLPSAENIVFYDIHSGKYFLFDREKSEYTITEIIDLCLEKMSYIVNNFEKLTSSWNDHLRNFDHYSFWNKIFNIPENKLSFSTYNTNDSSGIDMKIDQVPLFYVKKIKYIDTNSLLPKGFTKDGYLLKNPDVRNSGIDPEEHWLKYGRYEGRKF